jgi:multiple sugar transport system ATP-binding protein
MAEIKLKDITKRYPDGFEAVKDFNLEIADGEFVILVGPSGCGKSTALRMIAGLEDITEGELYIGDEVVNQRAPKDRDIAMVFQNYALYPHMTVRENMGFALKLAKTPQEQIDTKVNDAAKVLDLEQHLERKPANLSGGQRQRVAMGRAIVRDPSVFLMDEPLSNLDAKLRVQMRAEVSRIQHRLGTTTVYVTHDQTEAMTLGDRVAVMRAGVLQQVDQPSELYNNPVNLFVAGFIGSPAMNFFPATVEGDRLKLPFAEVPLPPALRQGAVSAGGDLIAGVRPEQFYDPELETGAAGTEFDVPIELVESLGAEVYVHFGIGSGGAQSEELAELAADSGAADVPSAGEGMAVARLEPATKAKPGERHRLGLHPESIHIFDARSGRNLAMATPAAAPAAAPAAGDGGGGGTAGPDDDQPSTTALS